MKQVYLIAVVTDDEQPLMTSKSGDALTIVTDSKKAWIANACIPYETVTAEILNSYTKPARIAIQEALLQSFGLPAAVVD